MVTGEHLKLFNMVTLFGQNLIFLTGILAGLFFLLSSFGCRCIVGVRFSKWIPKFFISNHNFFVKLALFFVFIHALLAIFANLGVFL